MSDQPKQAEAPHHPARFRKGTSGNPNGRPRKPAQSSPAIKIIIDKTLTIFANGRTREVTVEEALQHNTYRDAMTGGRLAQREVLKMIKKRDKALASKQPSLVVHQRFEHGDNGSLNAALLLLGIATHDPRGAEYGPSENEHLLLETWAVECALRRRRKPLNRRDLNEIKRCAMASDTVRWPEAED